MGARPLVQIQTPPFMESQWQYEGYNDNQFGQYGIYRTLVHRKTGQKIDQYDLSWINEEQYLYYLKSFNWRHGQLNVVNTRYLVQKNNPDFCSHTFMARVYIQHIFTRLSEIKDIPYPDNLYVLMQSLQGYSKIYEYSKYFSIEQNQICVDGEGNIKVWVNPDLSINYPNGDSYIDEKSLGEQSMVQKLVHLIAENTDRESEPQTTFLQYFEQKKGIRGKRFEQAKVLVLSYARQNEVLIPYRFDAVMHLNDEELSELAPQSMLNRRIQDQTIQGQHPYQNSPRVRESGNQISPISHYQPTVSAMPPPMAINYHNPASFSQIQPPMFHHIQTVPYSPQQSRFVNSSPMTQVQRLPIPVHYIPHYSRVQYPVRQQGVQLQNYAVRIQDYGGSPLVNRGRGFVQQNAAAPIVIENRPQQRMVQVQPLQVDRGREQKQVQQLKQIKSHKRKQSGLKSSNNNSRGFNFHQPDDIRVTIYTNDEGLQTGNHEGQHSNRLMNQQMPYFQGKEYVQYIGKNQPKSHKRSSSNHENLSNHFHNSQREGSIKDISEADDMVARSMPIKSDYSSSNSQPLNSFGQNDRAVFSHIHSKEVQRVINADGFGLSSSKSKLKDSSLGHSKNKFVNLHNPTKPVKYYYSLSEELEIDPDIAADLQKYLPV